MFSVIFLIKNYLYIEVKNMEKQKPQAKTIFSKHYSRDGDSGYFNIHQVKQKVDNYNTLINSFSNKESSTI